MSVIPKDHILMCFLPFAIVHKQIFVGGPTNGPSLSTTVFYLDTAAAVNGTCTWTNYPYSDSSAASTNAVASIISGLLSIIIDHHL
jgi:hypothetical protein